MTKDNSACLDTVRAKIGHYKWMLLLLRLLSLRHGFVPDRAYRLCKRFANRNKPYFISVVGNDTFFVGNIFDVYSVTWALLPAYESSMIKRMRALLKGRPGAFVDVGANCGVLAASVLQGDKSRKAFLFEPAEEAACRAAATMALNGLANARVYCCAVAEADGELTFQSPDGQTDLACLANGRDMHQHELHSFPVPCVALDSVTKNEPVGFNIALLKIDVEGHEHSVFAGAMNTIRKLRPVLIFEYVRTFASEVGWTLNDVIAKLQDAASYRFYYLAKNGDEVDVQSIGNEFLVNVVGDSVQ